MCFVCLYCAVDTHKDTQEIDKEELSELLFEILSVVNAYYAAVWYQAM